MARDVIIIGAGGHAKVVADIVLKSGDNLVGFLDDDVKKQGKTIYKEYKVIGRVADVNIYQDKVFVVAIGDNETRLDIVEKNSNLSWYTAIHPSAVIADTAKISEGTVMMAGAVINPNARIGRHCIINTACSIDHDCEIGDFVHISPGARLAGEVTIGDCSWICIGAAIINQTVIASDVVVGAGAVVLDDIKEPGIYVGVPARKR